VSGPVEDRKKKVDQCSKKRSRALNNFFRWMDVHPDNVQSDLIEKYYDGCATSFNTAPKEEYYGRHANYVDLTPNQRVDVDSLVNMKLAKPLKCLQTYLACDSVQQNAVDILRG